MKPDIYFSSLTGLQKIDAEKGVIHGVSVITVGEAQGHGLTIDSTTLSQVRSLATAFPGGVKVRLNHAPDDGTDPDVGAVAGRLVNFSIDGDKLRADLHLFKSDEQYEKILEMAQTIPESFGLSLAFSGKHEKSGDTKLARCTELYSVDLVDAPAANPDGLFSHNKDGECECGKESCKSCHERKLAKEKKESEQKQMSNVMITIDKTKLAQTLGLNADATEAEVEAAYLAKLSAKPVDLTELSTKLAQAETKLQSFEQNATNAVALSKKVEIDNLIAEAARDGRIVPLQNDELYTEKDGKVSIHMEPAMLAKIISRQPKGQIQLSAKREVQPFTDKDGKALTDPAAKREWCLAKQAEGAAQLNEKFSRLQTLN